MFLHQNLRIIVAVKTGDINLHKPNRWETLTSHWVKDFQLLIFILLILTAFRLLLLTLFGDQASDQTPEIEYISALWMGFRVDMGTAAAWVLITFLLSIIGTLLPINSFVTRTRILSASLFAILIVLILGSDLVFFKIYGDHFNQMILGLIYDDAEAIAITIWKEHNPIVFLTICISIIFLLYKATHYWLSYEINIPKSLANIDNSAKKIFLGFLGVIIFVITIRGGDVSGAPLQMRHIFVTNDSFLNRAIINPLFALRQTIKNQLAINRKNGLSIYWDPNNLPKALEMVSKNNSSEDNEIDAAIIQEAPGFKSKKPRHVFLILMESYSGWTLLPEYIDAGLSNGLKPYAEEGIHFSNFLSATRATADSLSVLVSGLPYAGLNINHEPKSLSEYPSSIAKIFNDLGYKTRFIYGGYIGWQRLDTFIKAQGFDEIHSAADIKTPTTGNEWGVDDEYMFQQADEIITDDTPSFNFILSTTSHSPYDLDLASVGFPLNNFPENVKVIQDNALEVMGHHWYADRELGKFLSSMENKLADPLFAISGDHSARVSLSFPNGTPKERAIVPFILYGPSIINSLSIDENIAGSHQDIIPTIVNLSAEKGFQYAAFGKDMLQKNLDDVGVGLTQMIGSNFIIPLDRSTTAKHFSGNQPILSPQQIDAALNKINAARGISWHRLRNGSTLTKNE